MASGVVNIGNDRFPSGQFLVLRPETMVIRNAADEPARLVLVGGETMDGPRHIWWNFVSSRPERIEQAKADWKAGRFGTVPGDAEEFIPLPDADKVASRGGGRYGYRRDQGNVAVAVASTRKIGNHELAQHHQCYAHG